VIAEEQKDHHQDDPSLLYSFIGNRLVTVVKHKGELLTVHTSFEQYMLIELARDNLQYTDPGHILHYENDHRQIS